MSYVQTFRLTALAQYPLVAMKASNPLVRYHLPFCFVNGHVFQGLQRSMSSRQSVLSPDWQYLPAVEWAYLSQLPID